MILATDYISTRHYSGILLSVFLLTFFAAPTAGQIVLDRSYFEDLVGETFDATQYVAENPTELQSVVDATGEDATYDLSGASYTATLQGTTRYFELPADFPGADDEEFADATYGVRVDWEVQDDNPESTDSTAWGYYRLNDERLGFHGLIYLYDADDDEELDTLKLTYDPALEQFEFPVEYESNWDTAATETFSFEGFALEDSVRYEYEVEGYGELVTPSGSADALRIREVAYSGVGTEDADTTTYLNFETREGLSASIELDDEGSPIGVTYTVEELTDTATDEVAEVPRSYELSQSYPNPFNPSTTIRYRLPQTDRVRLEVVDLMGRTVRVLVDERNSAGQYTVSFDGSNLPSGMYLYHLRAGSFEKTRSMMLVK